ncbi:MAG TPA: gfo/Idh/MocA family oxidoreductase [Kosmotogaceae bacterium]|nr:gfo/Idh/MocA family oxidoreductase [Kosmotogaceae bacterium]
MKKVKFGVLGISNHFVKRVLFPLKRSETVEIYAVASRSEEKSRSFAAEHGIQKSYGSYDELIEDQEVDAIYIPLPNHLHAEYSVKAARQGKHILCEKPLAMNYEETKMIVDTARNADVLLMEAFMYRFHPQWITARELAVSGELGKIISTICHFAYDNKDPKNIRNIKGYGGGALLDIGVYAVSSSRFLMNAEPKRVFCHIDRDPDSGVDIHTTGILDYESARSVFVVSTRTFADQRIHVFGSSGQLSVEVPFNMYPDIPGCLCVTTSIGTREIYTEIADQYKLQFEAFADAITHNRELPVSPEDSLANMMIIDSLFESAKKRQWVEL